MALISKDRFHEFLMSTTDRIFKLCSDTVDPKKNFRDFNIIAHRGLITPGEGKENSLQALKGAMDLPIAGVEFDVRWTKDMEPVVFHDKSLKRIRGSNLEIHELGFKDLRKDFPEIPHLEEVLSQSSKGTLMMEIKNAPGDWRVINKVLPALIEKYIPDQNFHIISLSAEVLEKVKSICPSRLILIAMTNINKVSEIVSEKNYGGIAGHYLMFTKKIIETHKSRGRVLGVGFPASLPSLYREYNRGFDFIFSNHAESLFESHLRRSLS